MLPLMRGATDRPVRSYAVHHSMSGRFAIRRGDWVYLEAPGGDDNREPEWFRTERGYPPPDGGAQLYRLGDDLSEARNRLAGEPALAAELTSLLDTVKAGKGPGPECECMRRTAGERP
jgi:arylsulfatase A